MSERYPWTPVRALEVVLCEDDVTAEEYDYFGRKKWARSSAEEFLREYIASSVPRAALEWVCGFADAADCPPGSVKLCDGDCAHCWLQAALKAAEEGSE